MEEGPSILKELDRYIPGLIADGLRRRPLGSIVPQEFGAVGDGVNDDGPSIRAAVQQAQVLGGTVYFPEGDYLIGSVASSDTYANGIVVEFNNASGDPHNIDKRVNLEFSRGARLLANDDDMIVLRLCDSYTVVNNPVISANGHANVVGIAIVPEDMAQTTARVDQRFNAIYGAFVQGCDEGLMMQCGPRVGGLDSGCWYNKIVDPHFHQCVRGVWLKDGPTNPSAGVNRNYFRGVRVGNSPMNTGVQIDSGDTNTFDGIAFEGISNGATPNATPTGLIVKSAGAFSGGNNHNEFLGAFFESCTRDLELGNDRTYFLGTNARGASSLFNADPTAMIGSDPAVTPLAFALARIVYQANAHLAGIPLNTLWISGRGIHLADNGEGITNIVQESGHIEQFEISDPAAPDANRSRIYTRDNGAGKSELVVRFNTGAIQVLATEP